MTSALSSQFLTHQLVLGLVDGQALVAAAVAQQLRIAVVVPVLVAPAAVAGVQDDFLAAVVEARLVPSYLSSLAVHPELKVRHGDRLVRIVGKCSNNHDFSLFSTALYAYNVYVSLSMTVE